LYEASAATVSERPTKVPFARREPFPTKDANVVLEIQTLVLNKGHGLPHLLPRDPEGMTFDHRDFSRQTSFGSITAP
jgi:hypothetical protein